MRKDDTRTPEEIKKDKTLFMRQTVWPLVIILVNFSIAMAILWWSGDWGKRFYSDNYLFRDGRMPIKQEDGRWHIMDDNGDVRSEGYTDIRPYSNRVAAVRNEDGKWGFINMNSENIVECIYDYAGDFSDSGLAVVKKDNEFFYINKRGEMQFNKKFIDATSFVTGSIAKVETKEGVGLLDVKGEYVVLPGQYKALGDIAMENGYVAVKNEEDKWGYIDSLGEMVVECRYATAESFIRKCAMVTNEEGLYGFVNEDGKEVIPCKYTIARNFSIAQYAAVCNSEGKWGFVNREGVEIIPCMYSDCLDFTNDESAAVCDENGLWGYVKNNGEYIVECIFLKATKFAGNDTAAVQKTDGKWIYIDRKGEQCIEEEFDYTDAFTDEEIAIVGKFADGKLSYAVIDEEGEYLVEYGVYDTLVAYDSGEIYGYTKDGKYTLLGDEGTVIAHDIIGFKPAGDVVVRR